MSWDGATERRRHPRAGIRLWVGIAQTGQPIDETPGELQTLNFSAGGFYCDVPHRLDLLTRLELRFVFPAFGPGHEAPHAIDCEAVVVRLEEPGEGRSGYRVAACFTRLAPEDRRLIGDYVAWHNEVYAEPPDAEADADGLADSAAA